MWIWLFAFLTSACLAQIPYEQLNLQQQEEVRAIVKKADFVFETRTTAKKVRLSTMEKLFDHPRLGAAMWRHCQFVPGFYTFLQRDGLWSLDDGKGLRGTLNLIYRKPGFRVYLVEGLAEKGRLKTPFSVSARMVTVYRYWEGPEGFESLLQTWTALDSALLGFVAKPFRGYIRHRQEEFIAYINGNVASFGEFADLDPQEFYQPLQREGDVLALHDFETLFLRK